MAGYKKPTMVTEEEIENVWGNANFGDPDSISRIDVVKFGTLKHACGYHQGHTSAQIIYELGLTTPRGRISARGRYCLWMWFGNPSPI